MRPGRGNHVKGFLAVTLTLALMLPWGKAESMQMQDGVYVLTASPAIPAVHKIMAPTMTVFAKNVEEKSKGRVKINFVWGSSLHKLAEGFEAIRNDVTDIAYTQTFYYPGEFPLSQFSALPYTFPNAVVTSIVAENLYPKYLKSEFEKRGAKLLFWLNTGPFAIYTPKPIRTLGDLRGLKIRGAGTMQNQILKLMGAVPTSVGSPEVYTAMQRGVLDGTMFAISSAAGYKFYEVTKYVTQASFTQIEVPASINPRTLAALPKDIQEIIYAEARLAGIRGAMLYHGEDEKAVGEFRQHGAEVVTASPELSASIKKLLEPIRQKYIDDNEKAGRPAKQLVADMDALVEKYSKMSFQEILELQRTKPVQGIW
jgi:TRAP-type transport system periplasmic protein